jgi:hypothetical protein
MTLVRHCSEYRCPANSIILISYDSYAISELQKDVERELDSLPNSERDAARTKFAVFVVHNKIKPKVKTLPEDIPVRVTVH